MIPVDISQLIDDPGASLRVDRSWLRSEIDTPNGHWGPVDEALASPIHLDLLLEMLVDGLVARGTVSFTTLLACARCLKDVTTPHVVDVTEMFSAPGSRTGTRTAQDPGNGSAEPDNQHEEIESGYELNRAAGTVDLEALVIDAISSRLPIRVLCSPDCQGLCPTCGADRNRTDCGHGDEQRRDPRWAPLEKLDLPE